MNSGIKSAKLFIPESDIKYQFEISTFEYRFLYYFNRVAEN